MSKQFFRQAVERRDGYVPPPPRPEQKAEGMAEPQPIVTMTEAQFQQLLKMAGSQQTGGGFTPDVLKEILTTVGQTNAQAMQKSLRPENADPPPVSAFNPQGKRDRVTLRRVTRFNGYQENDNRLTEAEIALYNAFTTDRSAHQGTWTAKVRTVNGEEVLDIAVPAKTVDDRMNLPSLTQILRELLEGEEVANPDAMAAEVARLRAEVEALKKTA